MSRRPFLIAAAACLLGLGAPGSAAAAPAAGSDPAPPAPVVTGVSPGSGSALGGTSVTITGSGFTGATAVSFGGGAAASFTVLSDSTITAVSPPGSGVATVTVDAPGGSSAPGPGSTFSYVPVPVVSGVTPGTGSVSGGTAVTIVGTGFTNASAVRFGNADAADFTVVSDTKITATTPDAGGTVDVRVTTAGGTSAAGPADRFTFVVAVESVRPRSGSTVGGDKLTVTGIGFLVATGVRLGSSYSGYVVVSDIEMLVQSPPGRGTVDLVVETTHGSSAATPADGFTYVPPGTTVGPNVRARPNLPPAAGGGSAGGGKPGAAPAGGQTRNTGTAPAGRPHLSLVGRVIVRHSKATGTVLSTRLRIDRAASILVSLLDASGKGLRLEPRQSVVGNRLDGGVTATLRAAVTRAGTYPLSLRLAVPSRSTAYRLRVVAVDGAGRRATLVARTRL